MAGQPISLTLPSNGDPFAVAAPQVVTALTTLEQELERKVVPADMSMSADLSFLVAAVNYSATDLKATRYALNAAALSAATFPRSLYFTGTDGDAYVNDGAGRQVRLTNAGVVNNASSGNITSTGSPAYGTSSVELRWDGADLEYEMRAGAGADAYADIRLDDVVFNDGSSNFIRLGAPSITSDYTITLPTAAPASTSVVQMSSAGALTASPSGAIATTGAVSTGALTASSLIVSGTSAFTGLVTSASNLTVSGTVNAVDVAASGNVAVTGSISASTYAGVPVTSNQHVTVAGTGRYKHGNFTQVIPAAAFFHSPTANEAQLNSVTGWHWKMLINGTLAAPLMLPVGKTVVSLALKLNTGAIAGTRRFSLKRIETSTDVVTDVDSATSTVTSNSVTLTLTPAHVLLSTHDYILVAELIDNDYLRNCSLVYTEA